MSKQTTPTTLPVPKHEVCPACKGAGKVKPMFYEQYCLTCMGAGVVDPKTGQALPQEEACHVLKHESIRLAHTIENLKNQLDPNRNRRRGKGKNVTTDF